MDTHTLFYREGFVLFIRFSKESVAQRGLGTIHLRTSGSSMAFWEPPLDSATGLGERGLGQVEPAAAKHLLCGDNENISSQAIVRCK